MPVGSDGPGLQKVRFQFCFNIDDEPELEYEYWFYRPVSVQKVEYLPEKHNDRYRIYFEGYKPGAEHIVSFQNVYDVFEVQKMDDDVSVTMPKLPGWQAG